MLQYLDDRLRTLIKFKIELEKFTDTISKNPDYQDIYTDILEQYFFDFSETIDYHIYDIKEEIEEASENEPTDFEIIDKEQD